jgi:hypothetical protein
MNVEHQSGANFQDKSQAILLETAHRQIFFGQTISGSIYGAL